MTDKEQIIIDGVNVYGCVQFIQEEEDCCNLGGSCKGWPNCYFKQLARKTQECEALKKRNEDNERFYLKQFAKKDSEVLDLTHKLNVKTQECEELKIRLMQNDEVNTFFSTPIEGWSSDPCNICESKNNYEQLKQECEELKLQLKNEKEVAKSEIGIYNDACNQLKEENEELYLERNALNTANGGLNSLLNLKELECDRYRKALDDIEKYVNSQLDGFGNDVYAMDKVAINKILDIINKAKGEGKCQ